MTEELQGFGFEVGHHRVGGLMRKNGIQAVHTREFRIATNSNHSFAIAPNLLDRNFSVVAPN